MRRLLNNLKSFTNSNFKPPLSPIFSKSYSQEQKRFKSKPKLIRSPSAHQIRARSSHSSRDPSPRDHGPSSPKIRDRDRSGDTSLSPKRSRQRSPTISRAYSDQSRSPSKSPHRRSQSVGLTSLALSGAKARDKSHVSKVKGKGWRVARTLFGRG